MFTFFVFADFFLSFIVLIYHILIVIILLISFICTHIFLFLSFVYLYFNCHFIIYYKKLLEIFVSKDIHYHKSFRFYRHFASISNFYDKSDQFLFILSFYERFWVKNWFLNHFCKWGPRFSFIFHMFSQKMLKMKLKTWIWRARS